MHICHCCGYHNMIVPFYAKGTDTLSISGVAADAEKTSPIVLLLVGTIKDIRSLLFSLLAPGIKE